MQNVSFVPVDGGVLLELRDGNKVQSYYIPAFGTAGAMPQMLPAATAADEGKNVTVDVSGKYTLTAVEQLLPEATAADVGKIVTVDENGKYVLAAAE